MSACRVTIICGDTLAVLRTLPSESVHCAITSPPYWRLRDYGIQGQIGLERTPEEYVEKLVEVFREIRRVLRGDGTLWLNIGFTYDGKGNLIDIPCMLRDGLVTSGWFCKAPIVWSKPNAMPASVEKRPTLAHEMVWLMAKHKGTGYFYDAEAIKEPAVTTRPELLEFGPRPDRGYPGHINDRRRAKTTNVSSEVPKTRNRRSVWTIATQGYAGAQHFAVFPPKLPEICIKAGTPEKGCCPKCGSPWERIVELSELVPTGKGGSRKMTELIFQQRGQKSIETSAFATGAIHEKITTGWRPTCSCDAGNPIPALILDPFAGAGTTGLAAARLLRDAVLIELNPRYCEMSARRIRRGGGMFVEVISQ